MRGGGVAEGAGGDRAEGNRCWLLNVLSVSKGMTAMYWPLVITGTLPRAGLTEKTEWCSCSYSGFHEWSTFFVSGENFDNMQRVKSVNVAQAVHIYFTPLPGSVL